MDEYLTDDERVEQVKRWVRENGAFVVVGLFIGVGSLFGWQRWQDYQITQAEEAAVVYENLLQAVQGDLANQAVEQLTILADQYSGTPYLDQARLAMAKMHMARNAPDAAAVELELLTSQSGDPQIRHIGRIRLARVRLHQGEYDTALEVLEETEPSAFTPQYHDARGDVYFSMGDIEQARTQYQLALDVAVPGVIERSYIQAKLDDLGPVGLTAATSDVPESVGEPEADDEGAVSAEGSE